jgi:hypothetical protein
VSFTRAQAVSAPGNPAGGDERSEPHQGRRLRHRPIDLLDRQSLGAEHPACGLQINGWVRSATSHGKVGFLRKRLLTTGPDGRALSPWHD